jgi:nucleotide-binding universal stress UspA family protein
MIRSLLLAVDSSVYGRSAEAQAIALSRAYQGRVTGLYVLDVRFMEMPPYVDYSYTFEAVPPTIAPLDIMDSFRAKSERILGGLRESMGAAGVPLETRAEEGVPSQVIADLGRAHDLIIMGKRGEHAKWGRDLLGSTAEQVARRSASPVLLVEAAHRPLVRAMVMFDGSDPANRALKLAGDLATHAGLALKVVTVDDDEDRGRRTQSEARAYLTSSGVPAEYEVMAGKPTNVASALPAAEPLDLVIIGMRGHSALHDLILGSTAEHVMRGVSLPILLVP